VTEGPAAGSLPEPRVPSSSGSPVVWSRDLFRSQREILIVHRDTVYRLRITRADKLILTK
jgi:hemin uptake protein HemP